ncbi:MAG TPA: carboxylesterase/lipase family protein [Bryobacteraceae bacterium]|jgi:para-nitrobenzyl esterase|nr:carboxylesterase/lipase family protein [Bryobacteraceae bacterium]
MMKPTLAFVAALGIAASVSAAPVRTASGLIEGTVSADGAVNIFKGIPFAAPPTGELRWKAPQPVAAWQGVRKATEFGPRCMQGRIFDDMVFRDSGPSEDCLYLNVWAPAHADSPLPVMVWIYGGGFQAGAASEPRQDGEKLAHKGVIVVSMNYRLGIFGFFSHPELTKESGHNSSGNYGFLDQLAALRWVHDNIRAFGGDPENVTIFGESAGSMSVNAQVTSPLSAGLFKQAIGESGGDFGLSSAIPPLTQSEQTGARFAAEIHAPTLKDLRAKSAQDLLAASLKDRNAFRFWPNVDGYFFPESPVAIYQAQKQNHVAVLAGWNTDEMNAAAFFGQKPHTRENYNAKLQQMFGDQADEALKLFPAGNPEEMEHSAGQLASAQFIAYSTWKWLEFEAHTPGVRAYRYHFEQAPPVEGGGPSRGAYHSADIEYVFETLDWKKLPWTDTDRRVSEQMSSYWTNFAKTGNPNGSGLPEWPQYAPSEFPVMHIGSKTEAAPDSMRQQYLFLDSVAAKRMKESSSAQRP